MKERRKSKTSVIDECLEKKGMTSREIIDKVIAEMNLTDDKVTRKKIKNMIYVRTHNRKKRGDDIGYKRFFTPTKIEENKGPVM